MGEARFKVAVALTILVLGDRSHAGLVSLEGDGFQEQASLEDTFHGQGGSLEDTFHGEGGSLETSFHGQHTDSVASSYVQFHGPVAGPEFEVKVPRSEHQEDGNHLQGPGHEYTLDYVAHPKYEFSYGVQDHHTGDFHDQREIRDGNSVTGQYSVKEPGGSVRVVKYRADKDGFHAVVHTSGQREHSTDYGGQGHGQVHVHQAKSHGEGDVGDYAGSYTPDGGY